MYTYTITVDGLDGKFTVEAENYAQGFEKAYRQVCRDSTLPKGLALQITDESVNVISTNAGNIFEEKLKNALNEFPTEKVDLVYDEDRGEYCIMYHSAHDSFVIFGIEVDEFIFEDFDAEDWLIQLANKYGIGYCF